MAPTSTCRTSVGVAVLGGYLYAVGGQDGVSCLNIVERYLSKPPHCYVCCFRSEIKLTNVNVEPLASSVYYVLHPSLSFLT